MMVAGSRLPTAEVERNQGIQSILYLIETTEFGETAIWKRRCIGLSAWVGFIRGGADMWGDNNKFYSCSAGSPSQQ